MISAIIIIAALGILDAMLVLACMELEKRQEDDEDERSRR